MERNVRGWLSGKNVGIKRETVFEIAFILGLTQPRMNALLVSLTDEGIRWREPDELILAFARSNSMSYPEAMNLRQRMGNIEMHADALAVKTENMTARVKKEVLDIRTEAELKAYLTESADKLGALHNTAYKLFMHFMKLLERPERAMGLEDVAERKMSTREILSTYLYRDMVPVGKRIAAQDELLTPKQKALLSAVKADWPDEAGLSKMKHREIDVTRKTLMLLFLATDGAGLSFGKKKDASAAELAQDSRSRIDRMLGGCGYSQLDPRSPFDWIVLYCLSVDDIIETDAKMADVLLNMFSGNEIQTLQPE